MNKLILHPTTRASFDQYLTSPVHAVLLVGPAGSGRFSLARSMAAGVLHRDESKLSTYPHFRVIEPTDGKAISIETIRDLQHLTTLKIPGSKGIARVIIIDSAHLLTTEAQNALLKMLEEPPLNTAFILTVPAADAVLPTIQSRTRALQVVPPPLNDLRAHLLEQFAAAEIDKALLVSGGLPGLTQALLTRPEDHPLYEATMRARTLLQATAYERLLTVDTLSKQKPLAIDVTFILGQMARMALTRSNGATVARWQTVMRAAFQAGERLRSNAQTKLVLMQLMLEI